MVRKAHKDDLETFAAIVWCYYDWKKEKKKKDVQYFLQLCRSHTPPREPSPGRQVSSSGTQPADWDNVQCLFRETHWLHYTY